MATTEYKPVRNGGRGPLEQRFTRQKLQEGAIRGALAACALLSIVTTLAIVLVLIGETITFFQEASRWNAERNRNLDEQRSKAVLATDIPPADKWKPPSAVGEFLTSPKWTPDFEHKQFGVRPLVIGTLTIAGIACLIGIPVGLASAIYLSEYASPRIRTVVKPTLEILAGVPTIVYGYFALLFITPVILQPFFGMFGLDVQAKNAVAAGIAVGIMIIPMVSSLSEEVLRSVPRGLREAAFALGSTKFDVSVKVVLPAALSGILASFLLAFARAVGETMAVVVAAGARPADSLNPLREMETMTAYIVNISKGEADAGSVEYYSLYAVGAALFVITLTTNIIADWILRRFREVYQ